jgi:hypothetical protein
VASIYLYTAEVSPTDIKLQNVVDDTPVVIIPPPPLIPIYNRVITSPQVIQYGSIGTPPTLKLRANPNTDIFLYEVLDQLPSTIQFLNSADIFLWDAVYFDSGVINLIIQDVSQIQVIDSFDISQIHSLSIEDILQVQNIEDVVITQTHVLIVYDLLQYQSIESPSIGQIHRLLIDNIIQQQSIQGLSISQVHNLIIQDMTQGGSMGNNKMKRWTGSQWVSIDTIVVFQDINAYK